MTMPLYVDLDDTLIHGDTMRRAFFKLLRCRPLTAIRSLWLMAIGSRVAGKELIARHVDLECARLRYQMPVLNYVREARAQGRRIVLASGTCQRYVDALLLQHPGLFDAGYGSGNGVNLIGKNKLARIQADAAGEPFEYLGDSFADIPIFQAAAVAGWVGGKALNFVAPPGTRLHRL